MPSISGAGLAAGAGGIASLGGGLISALGARSAAQTQQQGLNNAIVTQINEQQNLANMLTPYLSGGITGEQNLMGELPALTKPFNPTMDDLAKTPGYQFTLQQGLQGVSNAYSGQGLGNGVTTGGTATTPSGPGVKGALNYAQGLAASTYQQQFQNYLAQNSQRFNMMMAPSQLGEQAAAAWGGVSQNMSNTIGGLQSASGAAGAAGTMGIANALSQGLTGAGNSLGNFALLNSLGGGSLFGGSNSSNAALNFGGLNPDISGMNVSGVS